jgi:hypothetical protein
MRINTQQRTYVLLLVHLAGPIQYARSHIMVTYTLTRTEQANLIFDGEEIASIYGRWDNGVEWGRYHNLVVYRTDSRRYVLSIQYRTHCEDEQPHDRAVVVQDFRGLEEELAAYDPTSGMERQWPGFTVRSRYEQNAEELLDLVQRVQQGQPPPLRHPVVIQYGRSIPTSKHTYSLSALRKGQVVPSFYAVLSNGR